MLVLFVIFLLFFFFVLIIVYFLFLENEVYLILLTLGLLCRSLYRCQTEAVVVGARVGPIVLRRARR